MRSLEAVVVEILFGCVDDFVDRRWMPLYGCAATVSEQGVCVYLVMAEEKG